MAIKVILVPVQASAAGEAALTTAFVIARRFEGHVVALHVRADPRFALPYIGEGMSGIVVQEIMTAAETEAAERAVNARALFDRLCQEQHIPVVEAPPAPGRLSASWRDEVGREDETVARLTRLADIVVVGDRAAQAGAPPAGTILEAVLLTGGRPVIVVPPGGAGAFGVKVAVAWNASAEASRAVAAAMPVLRGAAEVLVLSVGEDGAAMADGLVGYFACHGIPACARPVPPGPDGTGAALLAEAARLEADLLVMGAYTHSRFREMIFGGVTRHVLSHAALPVLVVR